jgi:hypothetical protein
MSNDENAESVSVTLRMPSDILAELRRIRQDQRERLATGSWGRTIVSLSDGDENDDEILAQLLLQAYSDELREAHSAPRKMEDGPRW